MDAGPCQQGAPSSPQQAARDVRAGAGAVRAGRARLGQRIGVLAAQREALTGWASAGGLLLPLAYVDQFRFIGEGAEHRVYYANRAGEELAVKFTLPGKFGHSPYGEGYLATPVEYLERLAWQNALSGDDILVVGVIHDGEAHLEIVTTQPWVTANAERPNPTQDEITAYFCLRGFRYTPLSEDAPLYFNPELDLVAADAHDQNVIRNADGVLVAIDVVIGTPGPALRAEIEQAGS